MNCPNIEAIKESFYKVIKNEFKNVTKSSCKFRVYIFPQTWPSTALGLSNIVGLDVFTQEYTTVIEENTTKTYGVYFGDMLAYIIKSPNEVFFDDLRTLTMAEQSKCDKYVKDNTKAIRKHEIEKFHEAADFVCKRCDFLPRPLGVRGEEIEDNCDKCPVFKTLINCKKRALMD